VSKEKTLILKFIAVILLLVGHLNLLKFISIPYFSYLGVAAVTLFLVASGMGLVIKYDSPEKVDVTFIKKRLLKIYPPYVIVSLLYLAISYFLGKEYQLRDVLLHLLGFNLFRTIDPTMWFISFIVLNYLLFFIIFKQKISIQIKIAIFFLVSFLLFYLNIFDLNFHQAGWQFKLHFLGFPLGLLLGYVLPRSKWNHWIKIVVVPGLLLLAIPFMGNLGATNFLIMADTLIVSAVVLAVAWWIPGSKTSPLVEFIGGLSYEIYLVEWLVLISVIPIMGRNNWVGLIVILIIIGLAYALKILTLMIMKKLKFMVGEKPAI